MLANPLDAVSCRRARKRDNGDVENLERNRRAASEKLTQFKSLATMEELGETYFVGRIESGVSNATAAMAGTLPAPA